MTFKQIRNKKHSPVSAGTIENHMRGIAHHPFADCVFLINRRLGIALDETHWRPIWEKLGAEEKRKYPNANFRT